MIKTGWWIVHFDLTLDGDDVTWDDLDECSQQHILECIADGYRQGEIIEEIDEDDDADGDEDDDDDDDEIED